MSKTSFRLTYIGLSVALFLALGTRVCAASPTGSLRFTESQITEIIRIAKAIQSVNPKLDEPKFMEYATGIYRASNRYKLDPFILIAIAQQETTFRESLPEGAAGERGICQIRKMWLDNPRFIREFNRQSIADLERPMKSFLFAAWILRDLKDSAPKGALPFWSYYNARKFENRFKYYLAVNRNIATLRKHQMMSEELAVNTEQPARQIVVERVAVKEKAPAQLTYALTLPHGTETRPMPVLESTRKPLVQQAGIGMDLRIPPPSRWIPDTLRKLQVRSAKAKKDNSRRAQGPASLPTYVKATYTLPETHAEIVAD